MKELAPLFLAVSPVTVLQVMTVPPVKGVITFLAPTLSLHLIVKKLQKHTLNLDFMLMFCMNDN